MNRSKWTLALTATTVAVLLTVGTSQGATILLDDHFDNGDLATVGVPPAVRQVPMRA